jgi:hypothetical protein
MNNTSQYIILSSRFYREYSSIYNPLKLAFTKLFD